MNDFSQLFFSEMESLRLLTSNLVSPPVLAFSTGLLAVWVRSDLKFPVQVYQGLTIYLLLSIGYKGGVALADTEASVLALPLAGTVGISAVIPLAVYVASRRFLRFEVYDAAAMAAHYGSVSAVTFMASLAFLDRLSVSYEPFMAAIMAVMEIPAIFVALLLARRFGASTSGSFGKSVAEVLSGKSLILLMCGMAAGALGGLETRELMHPFLVAPFYGVLMLFLLEMGLVAGEKLRESGRVKRSLVAFAVLAPIAQGMVGLWLAWMIGFTQGGAVVFAVLCASASYIAAPAAVRVALPMANPANYVTASLGITFPFNLVIGIPLYYSASQALFG